MTHFLHRDDAPFGDDVWEMIDQVVVEAARREMTARKLLHVEGPYGLGVKAISGSDEAVQEGDGMEATVSTGRTIPVAAIRKTFTLPIRDIAAYEQSGVPFNRSQVAHAAIACARREDEILLRGSDAVGVGGLMNAEGSEAVELSEWGDVGMALDDLIQAVDALDYAGFHGPYALALAPSRYNRLFRRYPNGPMIEIEHIRSLVTDGIFKAPALEGGGVLIASGRQFATIVIGQDLKAGFIGPADGHYEFDLSETVALRLKHPGSVCVLE